MFTSDRNWIYRTHKKLRKRGFHPIHKSFPLGDVQCLSMQRVTVAFPDSKSKVLTSTTKLERYIFIDQYTDVKPKVESLGHRWNGYTFFRVLDDSPGEKPNDQPQCFVGSFDDGTLTEGASSSTDLKDFELIP